MMAKAIPALEKGLGAAFIQSSAATALQRIVQQNDVELGIADTDRELVTSFLSNAQGEDAPGTSEVVGILKTMHEEMTKSLASAEAAEKDAIAAYDDQMAAKTKEVRAYSKAIEEKVGRVGDVAVKIVQMKNDLGDTQDALAEDTKSVLNLKKSCATKTTEF